MEEEEKIKEVIPPVILRPKTVYGLRTDIIGNVQFTANNEVIYPVEGVLVTHDYVKKKQRFLRFPMGVNATYIIMSPNRKLLAILENFNEIESNIAVYDMTTMKKRRNVPLPHDTKYDRIKHMVFTHDSKSVVLLTYPPEELVFMITFDVTTTTYEGRPTMNNPRASAAHVACNPQDHGCIAVCGENLLVIMAKSEKGLTISNNVKIEMNLISIAFISVDLLMVGTDNDELLLIENAELKFQQKASEADIFSILWDQDQVNKEWDNKATIDLRLLDTNVKHMTAFPRGFCYTIFNMVFVFERVSKFKYERKTIITIPFYLYPEATYQIMNMAIDTKQETVVVTTKHSQIYVGILIVPETLKTRNLKFEPLGPLLHISDIVDVSICCWKTIIMTASNDQTIRIWNYETEQLELVRKFQVDVHIVELNPTGLMAAVGFSDQLRVTQIFMNELNIVKTYNFPRCRDVRFSNYGHFMAVAFDNSIALTSVNTLSVVRFLKGHSGMVLSVTWSDDDKYLFSGGAEGAIYQWDVAAGEKILEIVNKGTEYRTLAVTKTDPISVYTITNTGVLREFQNAEQVREVFMPTEERIPLTDLCLARSDMIMFVADDAGHLFNVQLPFMDTEGGLCIPYRFFCSRINRMRFTYDGTLFIVVSKMGTLAIFALDNLAGRVAPIDRDLMKSQEILVPRKILEEKILQITVLETRLKQQAEEFQYQMSQNEIFDDQQMAEVHKGYCNALEELKKKNNEIEESHINEMNQITFQINDIKDEHQKQLENLANQYSERMLIEYQKFTNLRDTMIQLRDSYEKKLKKSAGTLQDTVEGLETDYKKSLDERKELIRELMKEMQDKKTEFIAYCRQVEEENDRKMVDTQLQYENKLANERTEVNSWRRKAGVLQKKFEGASKEIEHLLEEVETLKEEHIKNQKQISRLNRNIDDLQKDISDRDLAISNREARIQELVHKNQELDKYKQVLSHKINELKMQIEPREFQINDKRKHIAELESELEGLNQNNSTLELQLKELKDKYLGNMTELREERHRSRAARECISNLVSEIYHASGKINSAQDLKIAVRDLFHKHASDDDLKRLISLDVMVRDEFHRQRTYIERVIDIQKRQRSEGSEKKKYAKLFKENLVLLEEIDKLRTQNTNMQTYIKKELRELQRPGRRPTARLTMTPSKLNM